MRSSKTSGVGGNGSSRPSREKPAEKASRAREYFSIQHTDWAGAESRIKRDLILAQVPSPSERLERLAEMESMRKRLKQDGDDAVFAAIKTYELGALWPGEWEDNFESTEEVAHVQAIRQLVCDHLGTWYTTARWGRSLEESNDARGRLRRLGVVLAGEGRGDRSNAVPYKFPVRLAYHRTLFRLGRALELLHALETWPVAMEEKVHFVADACGLQPERFFKYLKRQALRSLADTLGGESVKQAARDWVAEDFGIAEGTVSNII